VTDTARMIKGDLTLASAIDGLADAGFVEHFGVSNGALRSFDSGKSFRAAELVIREYHRFEGVSDPDDMSIVYGIEGPGGIRGTLVDAYGAYSDAAVSAFLQDVPIRGASRFGGGAAGRPWVFDRPREILEHSPIAEPSVFGSYHHGFSVPVANDPWHDEGGESGPSRGA
jgi:hypothetical protein